MQRRMRATAELENWVARLNAQVNSVWHSSPAASTPRWLLGQIGFWVARPGLDAAYQRQLVALARSRRAVAGVATSRKRLELQIGELERRAETLGDPRSLVTGVTQDDAPDQHYAPRSVTEQLADLRRQYADMRAKGRAHHRGQPAADGRSQCLPGRPGEHQSRLPGSGRGGQSRRRGDSQCILVVDAAATSA
jgi:hypothetical protein